jgi:phosphate starvation-inducible membrane PsiE
MDLKRANNYFGQLLTKFLVYAGITSTIMWLLINHTDYYKTIHSASMVYSILIAGCITIAYIWNKSLYKEYLIETKKNEQLTTA